MMHNRKKSRVAIVSPFLDKGHGTERIVLEWIALVNEQFDIHLYSQAVNDADLSKATWHRIPKLPGPHILNFLWWFVANHLWRAWDRYVRGESNEIVFSPGVNCLDADVISVHIVFAEFLSRVQSELSFRRNSLSFWPWLLHRRLYYQLISFLERHVYTDENNFLILIAQKTAADLKKFYRRESACIVLYLGLDHSTYKPAMRAALREGARKQIGLAAERFAVLMVGNDWHKKGIRTLLDAMVGILDLPVDLLLAGREDPAPFKTMARERGLEERVHFLPPRKDVEFYYAAADVYAGPSLEDTFALPPAEAMACGLPVIVSSTNGTCEIITQGVDGLVLEDPTDAARLAAMIRELYKDTGFRERLGRNAAHTAQQYTWERNGRELAAIFNEVLERKRNSGSAAEVRVSTE